VLRSPLPSAVGAAVAPLALLIAFMSARGSGDGHGTLALLVLSGQAFLAYVAHRLHRSAAATLRTQVQIQASFAEVERIAASTTEAYRRAEEADRAKTQFFATMSHELRTPLNAILGFSEVMKNEVLGSHSTPSYREYSSDIHGSGQQLLALINGILDLSRIASGQYTLREETSDLGLLVKASLDALSAAALAKSHEITLSIAPDLDPIRVDAAAVGQIVANLVSNAIKFTGPGGQIDVRVGWTSRGGQYVSVTDDGPGIPAEEIPLVLSSFGRGSLAVSNAEPGVGLGLPVARGLVELHGGRLILNSTLRRGTQATVVLPAVRCAKTRPTLASPVQASDGLET
jgi:two-component system, cell cycle sensor histidine kinase PleC